MRRNGAVVAQVEAVSILVAILTLGYLPVVRVWRSTGYDRGAGLIMSNIMYWSQISYITVARTQLGALPTWTAWYDTFT